MSEKDLITGSIKAKIREFLYDTQMEEAEHMAELMGCTPISDDLFDREVNESEKRVDKIEMLIPLAYAFVSTFSEAVIKHEMAHDEEKSKTPAQVHTMRNLIMSTSFPAIVATLSQMVDLGVIDVTVQKKSKKKRFGIW